MPDDRAATHMEIRLHNTQSGAKERFEPLSPHQVGVYVCGPTVYGLMHIGNALPAVVFDVLVRLLRVAYRNVKYVRNITDVDDKINTAAQRSGRPIAELADAYATEYRQDIRALGVADPDVEPRATEHITEIIHMIEALMASGHAYAAEGSVSTEADAERGTHVLFHVPSDPAYGSLAKRTLDEMRDGARVEVAPYKKDPKDFVLWKPSSAELPGWDSPWGRGRPGWHIECSAMIRKHLGAVIDIHGGGSDLAFPHHENECAQSRCVNGGKASVRYWMHNGMLTFGATKMSKSLGNVVTIRELLAAHDGETLRYALLSGHYRQSLAWSDGLLAQAKASLDALYRALRDGSGNDTSDAYASGDASAFPEAVLDALRDDLNTPKALAALHGLARGIHRASAEQADALRRQLLAGGWLLGLLNRTPAAYFQGADEGGEESNAQGVDAAHVEQLVAERTAARKARDFARADAIRAELADAGIELEDSRQGTRWRMARG